MSCASDYRNEREKFIAWFEAEILPSLPPINSDTELWSKPIHDLVLQIAAFGWRAGRIGEE